MFFSRCFRLFALPCLILCAATICCGAADAAPRVLIASSSPQFIQSTSQGLDRMGVRSQRHADTAPKIGTYIARGYDDVLIIDDTLPSLYLPHFIKMFKASKYQRTRVIVVLPSAAPKQFLAALYKAGATGVIFKPLRATALAPHILSARKLKRFIEEETAYEASVQRRRRALDRQRQAPTSPMRQPSNEDSTRIIN
jgi:DNA-binding NarL/FixJ family response regulator